MMKKRKRIGELLVDAKAITPKQLEEALASKRKNQKLGEALLSLGYVTEKQLIQTLEVQLDIPHVSLYNYPIEKDSLQYVKRSFAQQNYVMPLRVVGGELHIAMFDPLNYYIVDELELSTGLQIKASIAARDDLMYAINHHYANNDSSADTNTGTAKLDASVIEYLNQILSTGIQMKASDIHLEPGESEVRVRYRIDGQLRQDRIMKKDTYAPLVARIKILAELDITQVRLPQDGRFKMSVGTSQVDLRVATVPTVNGEKVVIRILSMSDAQRKISDLGFTSNNQQLYTHFLNLPSGLVLLTGPTGSGKSSTLYASVQYLNQEDINVTTIEDPVELQIEGINQIQVNAESGLTFAAGLRSVLRQDPNVIMVGEIRDVETAEIAIRSALTGHLVLSTLHTNNAVDAIPRLVDMGVEPYLVASSLKGVVAQRLVRRICMDCRKKRRATDSEKRMFADYGLKVEGLPIGVGCDSCRYTGYRGRFAIHEIIEIEDDVRHLLLNEGSTGDFHKLMRGKGLKSLMYDGLLKVRGGLTTIDEVMQVAADA